MEYSLYLNYRCNLRCPFCYVVDKLNSKKEKIVDDETLCKIVNYIQKQNKKGDAIFFFGGEPLVDYKIINKFLIKTKELKLVRGIYTNGILLDKVPLNFLKKFDFIFVSIDGDKKVHEKYRGKGNFNKVVKNVSNLKPKLKNTIFIARGTATEETNINTSVINLLKYFDFVHWQIVNKPKFINGKTFVKNYKVDIEKLFNFWLLNFKKGNNKGIIPFQSIIASIFFNYPNSNLSFRCGVGNNLQVIDYDGNIYYCDEIVGDSDAKIGNINGPKIIMDKKSCGEVFKQCNSCDVANLCRGRCRKDLEKYSEEHKKEYCNMTKALIYLILKNKDEIQAIINDRKLSLIDLYPFPESSTEEIP
jgi:uncharacterized protein